MLEFGIYKLLSLRIKVSRNKIRHENFTENFIIPFSIFLSFPLDLRSLLMYTFYNKVVSVYRTENKRQRVSVKDLFSTIYLAMNFG
jgi:hypothetical protein